jgi:hypothetical protein
MAVIGFHPRRPLLWVLYIVTILVVAHTTQAMIYSGKIIGSDGLLGNGFDQRIFYLARFGYQSGGIAKLDITSSVRHQYLSDFSSYNMEAMVGSVLHTNHVLLCVF